MENDEELHLSFLLSSSCQALPASYVKLRSYINTHSAIVARHHCLKLPKYFTSKSITCPYCYLPWSIDTSTCKLLPLKKSVNKRRNKNVNCDSKNVDTTQIKNTLMLKCKVCCKKSAIPLIRRIKSENTNFEEPEKLKHKKRKKKKDKSCGLNKIYLTHDKNHDLEFTKTPSKEIKKEKLDKKNQLELVKKQKNQLPSQNQKFINSDKISNSPCQLITNGKSEKKFLNPYATNINKKISNKNKKQLKQLQEAVNKNENSVKKTLKDFLTLIGP